MVYRRKCPSVLYRSSNFLLRSQPQNLRLSFFPSSLLTLTLSGIYSSGLRVFSVFSLNPCTPLLSGTKSPNTQLTHAQRDNSSTNNSPEDRKRQTDYSFLSDCCSLFFVCFSRTMCPVETSYRNLSAIKSCQPDWLAFPQLLCCNASRYRRAPACPVRSRS